MKLFTNTDNKDFIRTLDCEFIEEEYTYHARKLTYFGLPSESLNDIRFWDKYIGDIVAVEWSNKMDGYEKQSLLVSRALQLGYSNRLTLLRGDINDIIISDKDEVGAKVPYPFQLINLDYGGSVLYPDRRRIDALNRLFQKQKSTDFLLLITSNIREFDIKELLLTQERITKELSHYRPDLSDKIENYFNSINKNESLMRQILHLQFFCKYLAESNCFQIICYPAIIYEGSRATMMIHYVFRLRYQESSTRVISDQSLIDLLTQTSQKVNNGRLEELEPACKF